MSGNLHYFWFVLALFAFLSSHVEGSRGQGVSQLKKVGVEINWSWEDGPLRFGAEDEGMGLSVTRADFLMSKVALRRADGTWLQSDGWQAYFGGAAGKRRAVLEGVPAQRYTAVRFLVGVDPETNQADPDLWPAGHPLHPLVNGLHWGWQGGYIFMALEGHYGGAGEPRRGFSYHLAGNQSLTTVTLEGPLDLTRGGTIGVELRMDRILGGVNPAEFGESTHSREGDPRADMLRARVGQAFSLKEVMPEVWQEPGKSGPRPPIASRRGTAWPLRVSNRLPQVMLPADNPLTLEGVTLGRQMFHETRLSRTNTQSCASCHDHRAAFTDPGKRFSTGVDGTVGTRNAMPLFNLAWQQEFFWDGRVKRLRDQVLMPIADPNEMHQPLDRAVEILSEDRALGRQFQQVFGSPGITTGRIAMVLEQFLLTLVSQASKFDEALLGRTQLTPLEQRGLELFVTEHDPARNLKGADCFHCHGGGLFSNQGFTNNGLDLVPEHGRGTVTGLAADTGKFRVPSLRNIAVTAPYMHDGRFRTLEEVIDHYDHGVQRSATLDPNLAKHPAGGLNLSPADKAALVAFLHTLTDTTFPGPEPASSVLSHSKP